MAASMPPAVHRPYRSGGPDMNEQQQYSSILARIPQELQPFDERHGTAKVGVAELRAAVDWLVS